MFEKEFNNVSLDILFSVHPTYGKAGHRTRSQVTSSFKGGCFVKSRATRWLNINQCLLDHAVMCVDSCQAPDTHWNKTVSPGLSVLCMKQFLINSSFIYTRYNAPTAPALFRPLTCTIWDGIISVTFAVSLYDCRSCSYMLALCMLEGRRKGKKKKRTQFYLTVSAFLLVLAYFLFPFVFFFYIVFFPYLLHFGFWRESTVVVIPNKVFKVLSAGLRIIFKIFVQSKGKIKISPIKSIIFNLVLR